MENKNYTIKDIARLAGVSAGTVDRVLHNRGDVSESSRIKVQTVLDEIDYKPNMFAIGLAAKKKYRIVCVTPFYKKHDYWYSVAQGLERAAQEFKPFNVSVDYIHYQHANRKSYEQACLQIAKEVVDAVLIAPNFREETLRLTTYLERAKIPYLFIDFNIESANPICYIGQDSIASGYIAAKILMRKYEKGQELVLFLNNGKDNPAEIQMQRRLEGFMKYISERYNHIIIHDVLFDKDDVTSNKQVLDDFFSKHPNAKLGVVFNSRIYQVASYLRESGEHLEGLLGYDLLPDNVDYLSSGDVNYLIGQRPGLQGYYGIKALCDYTVFKKTVTKMKYMPIDILMKENIDFYFEFE
ncbi:substrate-binding domain-containing protein [Bacteroidaceae bacterium HV4-6-C5C]|nr:substrate-binding domain-containing protein [Bacteroidaceae bacterium HV4-6-C5C]